MKKLLWLLFALAGLGFAFTSCSDDDPVDVPPPPADDTLEVAPLSWSFKVDDVDVSKEFAVEASKGEYSTSEEYKGSQADWLEIFEEDDAFTVTVLSANPEETIREAVITVTSGNAKAVEVTIKQDGTVEEASYLNIETTTYTISEEEIGKEIKVELDTNLDDYELEYDEAIESWLEITKSDDYFTVTNISGIGDVESRTAEIVVKGQGVDDITIDITQQVPYLIQLGAVNEEGWIYVLAKEGGNTYSYNTSDNITPDMLNTESSEDWITFVFRNGGLTGEVFYMHYDTNESTTESRTAICTITVDDVPGALVYEARQSPIVYELYLGIASGVYTANYKGNGTGVFVGNRFSAEINIPTEAALNDIVFTASEPWAKVSLGGQMGQYEEVYDWWIEVEIESYTGTQPRSCTVTVDTGGWIEDENITNGSFTITQEGMPNVINTHIFHFAAYDTDSPLGSYIESVPTSMAKNESTGFLEVDVLDYTVVFLPGSEYQGSAAPEFFLPPLENGDAGIATGQYYEGKQLYQYYVSVGSYFDNTEGMIYSDLRLEENRTLYITTESMYGMTFFDVNNSSYSEGQYFYSVYIALQTNANYVPGENLVRLSITEIEEM